MMRRRIATVVLLSVAVAMLIATVWRARQLESWQSNPPRRATSIRLLAPRFTLEDHHRKVIKLERFLGRQRVVLVFLDPASPLVENEQLQRLIEAAETIEQAGIEIVCVTSETPFAIAQAETGFGREFPFPVVTDIDRTQPVPLPAHRAYGLVDQTEIDPQPAIFLINRDGTVVYGQDGFPQPVADAEVIMQQLIKGVWPQPIPETVETSQSK